MMESAAINIQKQKFIAGGKVSSPARTPFINPAMQNGINNKKKKLIYISPYGGATRGKKTADLQAHRWWRIEAAASLQIVHFPPSPLRVRSCCKYKPPSASFPMPTIPATSAPFPSFLVFIVSLSFLFPYLHIKFLEAGNRSAMKKTCSVSSSSSSAFRREH